MAFLHPVLLTVLIVASVYLFVQILRVASFKLGISFNICASCFSVYSLWIVALFYDFLPPAIVALLMGVSVMAAAIKFKEYSEQKGWEGLPYKTVAVYVGIMLSMMVLILKRWV